MSSTHCSVVTPCPAAESERPATGARRPRRRIRDSDGGPRPASPNMIASGLSGRRLRSRSRWTAGSLVASTISWNPPSPWRARIRPAHTASAAWRKARSPFGQRLSVGVQQGQLRPALRAGDRLGVESAVAGILVFGLAVAAHAEGVHRGPRPIVRQLLDDRPARAAVGTVGERVAIAALLRDRRSPASTRRRWPDRRGWWDAVPPGRNSCGSQSRLETARPIRLGPRRHPATRCGPGADERVAASAETVPAIRRPPWTSIRTASASFSTQPLSDSSRAAR